MSYEIQWKKGYVYVKHYDKLTLDELEFTNNSLHQDIRFEDVSCQVFDFLEISESEITAEQALSFAAYDRGAAHSKSQMNVVIISNHTELNASLQHYMKGMEGAPWEVNIYESIEDATLGCVECFGCSSNKL